MRAAKSAPALWEGWDELRFDAAQTAFSEPQRLADVWSAPWETIADLQLIPGIPLHKDEWTIPRYWASGGAQRNTYARSVDFSTALPEGWQRSDAASEQALRRLKRLAVVMLLQTGRIGRNVTTLPKPSTWIKELRALCRIARLALTEETNGSRTNRCPDGGHIFADLTPAAVDRIREASSSITGRPVVKMA